MNTATAVITDNSAGPEVRVERALGGLRDFARDLRAAWALQRAIAGLADQVSEYTPNLSEEALYILIDRMEDVLRDLCTAADGVERELNDAHLSFDPEEFARTLAWRARRPQSATPEPAE